ncbi:MAG TPA: KH domain-containing protein [Bacillus sp. (in: firmicutes)]|uniref:KH domain-containing protein n=1 Tax=Bacillus litorisediminis TaxID=2922713 RepID=UPI001FACDE7B|nr:KH domain-containing protein [Bacillus litorisediminis]HWO77930.1 KH domain-containing protein [Bacillus sp. (in: firmicutes)]
MKELIETIVKPLVEFPEDVRVDVVEEKNSVTYKLSVNKNDIGKVIGKQGRVAKAIRTVVYAAAAAKQDESKKVYVDIVD